MRTDLVLELDRAEKRAVQALIRRVNEADGTNYDPALSDDFFYLLREEDQEGSIAAVLSGSRLGETSAGREVLELSAFTDPEKRTQGFFSLLLDSLRDDFRKYCFRFLVKPPISEGTAAALAAFDGELKETELFMVRELSEPVGNPGSFEDRFGEVYFTPYNQDTLYLYGLLTYDGFLRQGHASEKLEKLFHYPAEGGNSYRRILLQVNGRNHEALPLYRKKGFKVTEESRYYEIPSPCKSAGAMLE